MHYFDIPKEVFETLKGTKVSPHVKNRGGAVKTPQRKMYHISGVWRLILIKLSQCLARWHRHTTSLKHLSYLVGRPHESRSSQRLWSHLKKMTCPVLLIQSSQKKIMIVFMFLRVSNPFLTLLLRWHIWWPRKSRSTLVTGGTRMYWWLCLIDYHNFVNIPVFEVKEFIPT